ncbi:hypothetical protein HZS_1953 [Henneguya salminicola]|nr:hypothetical protein HZS_1953 [Henneguya salminicola]
MTVYPLLDFCLTLSCKCSDVYFGHLCQYKSQCHNCENHFCNHHNCGKCKEGWEGKYCQFNVALNYCKNGGILRTK